MYSETLVAVADSSYSWCHIAFEDSGLSSENNWESGVARIAGLSSESNWEFDVACIAELQLPVVTVGFLQHALHPHPHPHPPLRLLPLPFPLPGPPEMRQQVGRMCWSTSNLSQAGFVQELSEEY